MANDLLSSSVDPTGLMSLLTPVVTGGAMPPPPAGGTVDPATQAANANVAMPAWLAFAQSMGRAAGPHYGPNQPIGASLADAMGAAYTTARQAQMMPVLQAEASMNLQSRALDLAQKQWQFDQERQMWGAFGNATSGVSAAAPPPGGGAGGAGGAAPPAALPGQVVSGPPATPQQIASLPEVQAIADPTVKQAFMTAAIEQGMPLPAVAQYARQVKFESGGLQNDTKTGAIITSSTGAQGAAQIEPGTFGDMKKLYPDITGDITDPASNIRAGMHYFNQGLKLAGGNLAGGAVYYNGGPKALGTFLQSGQPTPETASYAVNTGALPTMPKGYGTPGGPAPPGDLGPPVHATFGNQDYGMVPQQIEQQARNAALQAMGSNNMYGAPGAYSDVINNWRKQQVRPGPLPGTQVSGTGQESEAPRPTQVLPMTPAEISAIPGADPRQPWMKTVYLDDGSMAKPPEVASPRVAQAQITQEAAYRDEYLKNPIVSNYNNMQNYYSRMQGVMGQITGPNARDPQSYDDVTLLHNFAHIQDPTLGVGEGREAGLLEGAGIPGFTQQTYAHVMGGGMLLPEQRQWLMQSASAELAGQQASAQKVLDEKRWLAAHDGLRPDQIGPASLGTPRVLPAATPPAGPTPAVQPTIPHPGVVMAPSPVAAPAAGTPRIAPDGTALMPNGQPVLGPDNRPVNVNAGAPGVPAITPPATVAPPAPIVPGTPAAVPPGGAAAPPPASLRPAPAAPPAPAAQGQTATPTVIPSRTQFEGMSKPGLAAIIADMKANPGRYTPEYRAALGQEIERRRLLGAGG